MSGFSGHIRRNFSSRTGFVKSAFFKNSNSGVFLLKYFRCLNLTKLFYKLKNTAPVLQTQSVKGFSMPSHERKKSLRLSLRKLFIKGAFF